MRDAEHQGRRSADHAPGDETEQPPAVVAFADSRQHPDRAERDRLLELGARPADIGQTGEEPWHVLADPEGNEFCLLKALLAPL